jgi:hypothetical protein
MRLDGNFLAELLETFPEDSAVDPRLDIATPYKPLVTFLVFQAW